MSRCALQSVSVALFTLAFVSGAYAQSGVGTVCTPAVSAPIKVSSPPRAQPSGSKVALVLPAAEVCFHGEGEACMAGKPTCANDNAIGAVAWKYFENNYQPSTGLVNAADKYPSTTMWDVSSALAGTLSAHELGLIKDKDFDDRITALLATLTTLKLYGNIAPNKAYNTQNAQMVDYNNKPSDGIGFSALDLARMASWLELLSCLHPKYLVPARNVILRWKFCDMIKRGQMYGGVVDPATKKLDYFQEGRFGYEQYGGKIFAMLGFDQQVANNYHNEYLQHIDIYGVPVAYDVRDPRKLGGYNYVVTESYALDAIEFGRDTENTELLRNIYEVQKRRWQNTGQVTAVSEDNVDRPPYFVYNTIFAAGSPWNTITDTGVDQSSLKSVSTKAAFTLAALFPGDSYSATLFDAVKSAYDPERGWYSGVYESGIGYNKALTANTNGIILEALLYKSLGPLHQRCARCGHTRRLNITDVSPAAQVAQCLPGVVAPVVCATH